MQTRRDQLQAYRFQNRRALAALVTGEPNVIEPPMRRLTATTVSGIMIAVLIAAGFALVGFLRPTTGAEWKSTGKVVVERETGATYVRIRGVLHPTLNYASAVLAAGNAQGPSVVEVDRGELDGAPRGPVIGIAGLPASLPPASQLVTDPWTVCSRQSAGVGTAVHAGVSVVAGDDAGARAVPSAQGVLVQTPDHTRSYLLYRGRRLAIDPSAIGPVLRQSVASATVVGTAFLDGIPIGPALQPPAVPGLGTAAAYRLDGTPPLIGRLVHLTDTGQDELVLRGGLEPLTEVQAALFQTLRLAPGNTTQPPIRTTQGSTSSVSTTPSDWAAISPRLAGLPDRAPTLSPAARNGAVCAVYPKGATQPFFAVPANSLPSFVDGAVTESAQSAAGRADQVQLPPGRAAVVRAAGASTQFVVAEPGRRFPVPSRDVLAAFGYDSVRPVVLPRLLLNLIRSGPVLDPSAARRPVSS